MVEFCLQIETTVGPMHRQFNFRFHNIFLGSIHATSRKLRNILTLVDFHDNQFFVFSPISRRILSKWFWRPMKCTPTPFSITLTSLGRRTPKPVVTRREARAECRHTYGMLNIHFVVKSD